MSAASPLDEQNDRHAPLSSPEIVVCPNGPLLVRGDFTIAAANGGKIPRRRRTVALCRCGASGIKPYCDGTHKLIGFRTKPDTENAV
ncbi:CDGSH iron-sulfur domain-containing protein [Arthrobacter psychrolactophilus]|uniref:CDGSH iron-sulfur domain-containing protein n=2 Tax=Arthrobacter psychrolactophilus TaxID=92442 RepID=A0A2V5J7E9_9MICC|nr:CDGSH iron-sulfur domain-containing protein [Arthrobacter psychrolactophilus]